MSEQAPERTSGGQGKPQGKPGSAKRGLTKKIGPLPLWAWGGLAIGGALAFYFARGSGKKKSQTAQPTTQPTGQASANPGSLAGNYPYLGFPTTLPTQTTSTSTTGTTSTTDEGPGDQDTGPGGKGKTGGWKGQHSNGQGSHHGGKQPPTPGPGGHGTPGPRQPAGGGVNPGGPVRRPPSKPRVPRGINPGGPVRKA